MTLAATGQWPEKLELPNDLIQRIFSAKQDEDVVLSLDERVRQLLRLSMEVAAQASDPLPGFACTNYKFGTASLLSTCISLVAARSINWVHRCCAAPLPGGLQVVEALP